MHKPLKPAGPETPVQMGIDGVVLAEVRAETTEAVRETLYIAEIRPKIMADFVATGRLLEEYGISIEELEALFDLLLDSGVIAQSIRDTTEGYQCAQVSNYIGALPNLLFDVLPQNFILQNIEKIREIKRKHRKPTKLLIPSEEGLFHVTTDKALLKIIRGRSFKTSTEVDVEGQGTGEFEQHLGADGIFTCYGRSYEASYVSEERLGHPGHNILVFPSELIYGSSTICINNELSLTYLHDAGDGMGDLFDSRKIFDLLEKITQGVTHDPFALKEERQKLLLRYTWTFLLNLMSKHLALPEDIIDQYKNPNGNALDEEIVLRPDLLAFPQMIIVEDDPGLFYDEAKTHWPEFAEQVPIVTEASARAALEIAFPDGIPNETDTEIDFSRWVRCGKIDVNVWRYRP